MLFSPDLDEYASELHLVMAPFDEHVVLRMDFKVEKAQNEDNKDRKA